MKRATIHFDGGGQSPGPVTAACTLELGDGSCVQRVMHFDKGTHSAAEWDADAGSAAVGPVRELERRMDSARGELARRRTGASRLGLDPCRPLALWTKAGRLDALSQVSLLPQASERHLPFVLAVVVGTKALRVRPGRRDDLARG